MSLFWSIFTTALELTLSKILEKIQSLRPAASRRKAAAYLAEKLSLQFLFCGRHQFFTH